ncbi:MAG: serine/threonine-protein kinase [Bdellovibrionales bacterium]
MQAYNGLAPGTQLGPFRVLGKIAEGGMGEIYEGVDDELNRKLAIKILLPSALREADGLARFKGEAKALAKINHENIVRVILSGEAEGLHYMALEYIEGWPLDTYLSRFSPSLAELLELFAQMVEGLQAAHELDIIHRDIKPQNVMVTNKGKVKIVDFGVAKEQTAHDNFKTTVGVVVGTRSFLAPEILRGAPATKQGDIYSLGLILRFMLSGEMPSGNVNENATRPMTTKVNLLLPQPLLNVLNTMTHPGTNLRFTDLNDVLKELMSVNLRHLPPELLAVIPNRAPVADLDKWIEVCKRDGLDLLDARMAINLAAKPGHAAAPADNGKTQVMDLKKSVEFQVDNQFLARTIQRVKQTKSLVLTGGIRTAPAPASSATPIPSSGGGGGVKVTPMGVAPTPARQVYMVPPKAEVPYFKIGAVVIILAIALRAVFASPAGDGVLAIFKSTVAKVQTMVSGRKPASEPAK